MSSSRIIKTHRVQLQMVTADTSGGEPQAPESGNLEPIGPVDSDFQLDGSAGQETLDWAHQVENAKLEAEAIIREAELESERVFQAAQEEGYAAGWREGVAQGQAEAQSQIELMRRLADELRRAKAQLAAECEQEVVNLALAIAQKIVRVQASVDRELVTRVVEAATQGIATQDIVRIAVNPTDLETISGYWSEEHDPGYREHGLEFTADERVEVGGCVVTTKRGTIDAKLEVQISEIERAFNAAAESH
ncbi:MAG: FliH/SctL family protein [Chloroflexi bacterium]|nr:FliH/SctL family protein [Chloroflexota bacterium]